MSASAPLSGGDPKDPGPAPGAPQQENLPGEEPEGNGEDDEVDHRLQFSASAVFSDHQSHSVDLPENTKPLPTRRRFLEFCKLKLDC